MKLTPSDAALLDSMMRDMQHAPALYRPTSFWDSLTEDIAEDLRQEGIENFRRRAISTQMYVPIYQRRHALFEILEKFLRLMPRTSTLREMIRDFLSNKNEACKHYVAFAAANVSRSPRLDVISESDYGAPVDHFVFGGNDYYSASFLRCLRGLAFLKKHTQTDNIETILEIGGGYGTLGEIFLKCPDRPYFYVNVDLPPVGFVATHYLRHVFGADNVAGYDVTRDMILIDPTELRKKYRAVVLCPWQLPRLQGFFDLFVNMVSFQEMEPAVVENYAREVQRLVKGPVLLQNSVHGKALKSARNSVGVEVPTKRADYARFFSDYAVLASDAAIFGTGDIHAAEPAGFASEVAVLTRRES